MTEPIKCPKCGSTGYHRKEDRVSLVSEFEYGAIVITYYERWLVCECGHTWKERG